MSVCLFVCPSVSGSVDGILLLYAPCLAISILGNSQMALPFFVTAAQKASLFLLLKDYSFYYLMNAVMKFAR